jgi:hypothetical protein
MYSRGDLSCVIILINIKVQIRKITGNYKPRARAKIKGAMPQKGKSS